MCVIIVKDNDQLIDKMQLVRAEELNPDGLGIIWLDTKEVVHTDSDDWAQLLTKRPFIAHFRYATVGAVNKANTHPYRIKGKDEWLMMNGTVPGYGNKECSDTRALADYLSGVSKRKWTEELASHPAVRFLTFNENTGKYRIYNRSLWSKVNNIWYSKTGILESVRIAVYGTLRFGGNNYYNYLSGNSTFIGSGYTANQYPLIISGLPYLVNEPGLGHNVSVDVFTVTNETLEELDALEGHPNWYYRKRVPIKLSSHKGVDERTVSCWIYFNDTVKDWKSRPWHKSYFSSYNYGSYGSRYGYKYDAHSNYVNGKSLTKRVQSALGNGWVKDADGIYRKVEQGTKYDYFYQKSGVFDNVFRIIEYGTQDAVDLIEVDFKSGAYKSLAGKDLSEFGIDIADILLEYGETCSSGQLPLNESNRAEEELNNIILESEKSDDDDYNGWPSM
jgi:gamma-glutamylaminecyclotransferase